jgi:hypothetical protein
VTAPKLTAAQRRALIWACEAGGYTTESGVRPGDTAELQRAGYVARFDLGTVSEVWSYVATPAGRAALDGK